MNAGTTDSLLNEWIKIKGGYVDQVPEFSSEYKSPKTIAELSSTNTLLYKILALQQSGIVSQNIFEPEFEPEFE